MPRCRVPVLARVVAHLRYWQAGRGRPSSSPLRCALLRMPRYACFSWLAAWRHRRGLHDRRLLLFACMVHPVRLLGICRVDRLDESFLWPALCRLGCHRRSGPHHFRCCFLVCAFVMPCFVDPAISVIAAVSCRCQCPCSCVTRMARVTLLWPLRYCTSSSWRRCCSCTSRAFHGLPVLFVAFPLRRILTGK